MISMRLVSNKIFQVSLFLLVHFLSGCGFTKTPEEYVKFVEGEKNGYRKEFVVATWRYKVQYKPAEYIYLQENKVGARDVKSLQQRVGQLKKWCFFNVYVSNDSFKSSPIRLVSTNREQYDAVLAYYLNVNRTNFSLSVNSKKLPAIVYNYENSYNLSPQDVFVVGFEVGDMEIEGEDKVILEYNDETLKTGILRFAFDANIFNKRVDIKI